MDRLLVKFPLKLDEGLAKLSAMILDGSISKDFASCMFYQKKDPAKVAEFASIVEERFGIKPRFPKQHYPFLVVFSNKSLAFFLNKVLGIHKSDENARIPKWIWDSNRGIMKEYLRYAFAMEGSITDPEIRNNEIRFHSCDEVYTKELSNFLEEKFGITSKVRRYFIKDYGWKYCLSLNRKEEIVKFSNIGFALKSHQTRLNRTLELYKPHAWETTLLTLFNFKRDNLSLKDIRLAFPYLNCIRSIHERLSNLIEKGFLVHKRDCYTLTKEGKNKAASLEGKIKIVPLRTNPSENERKILEFLVVSKQSHRNEISRNLKIPAVTIRDGLKRLAKKRKIEFIGKDSIGRKIWMVGGDG